MKKAFEFLRQQSGGDQNMLTESMRSMMLNPLNAKIVLQSVKQAEAIAQGTGMNTGQDPNFTQIPNTNMQQQGQQMGQDPAVQMVQRWKFLLQNPDSPLGQNSPNTSAEQREAAIKEKEQLEMQLYNIDQERKRQNPHYSVYNIA